ncbi:site-2 protease. Metallo peptidase. MEROPS family M50B [Dyadobacter koreensis]|uniref:Zinc metalloprotease n=1 Tax=Dyadobacter koreensis TaxID=408657 RepID=A0A1H6WRP5_9BACT|nr:RIP metalloprotease RseP [Dyadobacter koreensis]SEJ15510.1 site-2 protease. Metallo peptidase. MEROPS family M50B [Dyadobacter koreensis]
MEILIMAGQLILGLSILVGLHEWGHMFAAKMFGMRVEKYFIGFPPKIWSIQKGETEYGIGAIPLGGFVKISGMIDESMDTEAMNKEPQPWEFRSKPAWQRLIVMLGGIIVNVIVGVFIFIVIAYKDGEKILSKEEVNKYGIVAGDLAQQIGLKTGDKIVKVNGKSFTDFNDVVSSDVFLGSNSSYTVNRNGQEVDIDIPNNFIEKLSDPEEKGNFIRPAMPFKIAELVPGMPAAKAGLKPGDKIVSINGSPIRFYNEIQAQLPLLKGKEAKLGIEREGRQQEINVNVSADGTIGFYPESLLATTTINYTLGQAVSKGTENAFAVVFNNIKGFGKIFRGEVSASKALSGPIGIARMFGGIWDWSRFWYLTGLLSMVLAFMNALPIPALDGGHAVILSYEIISGRKPSDAFLENAQKVGMVLLLGLMAFAIFNDVWKAVF